MCIYTFSRKNVLSVIYLLFGGLSVVLVFIGAFNDHGPTFLIGLIILCCCAMCAFDIKRIILVLRIPFVLIIHGSIALFIIEVMGLHFNIWSGLVFLILFIGGMRATAFARKHSSADV